MNLNATIRNEQGRGASRRLRTQGYVPAIVYGSEIEPITIKLDHNTIYYALKKEVFHTSIINLQIAEQTQKVILRDFQVHPFRQQVLHLDFQRVSATEEIDLKVPLHFLHEEVSPAVKTQSAHITHVVTEIEVRALAEDLPPFIEIDLANLTAGQTIHLSDLNLPPKVKAVNLLRGEDSAILIAGGIAEVKDSEMTPIATE